MEDAFEGLLEVEGRLAVFIPLIAVLMPRGWFWYSAVEEEAVGYGG